MSRGRIDPRLAAGLVAAAVFVLGVVVGVAGDRLFAGRPAAGPAPAPLTVEDLARTLELDPVQSARVSALLDSLRPGLARAAEQGPDSLRAATARARARIAGALPPVRRREFQRWLDAHHARMMETMHRMGPGMMDSGRMGPGMMDGGMMDGGMMGRAPRDSLAE